MMLNNNNKSHEYLLVALRPTNFKDYFQSKPEQILPIVDSYTNTDMTAVSIAKPLLIPYSFTDHVSPYRITHDVLTEAWLRYGAPLQKVGDKYGCLSCYPVQFTLEQAFEHISHHSIYDFAQALDFSDAQLIDINPKTKILGCLDLAIGGYLEQPLEKYKPKKPAGKNTYLEEKLLGLPKHSMLDLEEANIEVVSSKSKLAFHDYTLSNTLHKMAESVPFILADVKIVNGSIYYSLNRYNGMCAYVAIAYNHHKALFKQLVHGTISRKDLKNYIDAKYQLNNAGNLIYGSDLLTALIEGCYVEGDHIWLPLAVKTKSSSYHTNPLIAYGMISRKATSYPSRNSHEKALQGQYDKPLPPKGQIIRIDIGTRTLMKPTTGRLYIPSDYHTTPIDPIKYIQLYEPELYDHFKFPSSYPYQINLSRLCYWVPMKTLAQAEEMKHPLAPGYIVYSPNDRQFLLYTVNNRFPDEDLYAYARRSLPYISHDCATFTGSILYDGIRPHIEINKKYIPTWGKTLYKRISPQTTKEHVRNEYSDRIIKRDVDDHNKLLASKPMSERQVREEPHIIDDKDLQRQIDKFDSLPDKDKRIILGSLIHKQVSKTNPTLADRITGMLIDPEVFTISEMIKTATQPKTRDELINEALTLLETSDDESKPLLGQPIYEYAARDTYLSYCGDWLHIVPPMKGDRCFKESAIWAFVGHHDFSINLLPDADYKWWDLLNIEVCHNTVIDHLFSQIFEGAEPANTNITTLKSLLSTVGINITSSSFEDAINPKKPDPKLTALLITHYPPNSDTGHVSYFTNKYPQYKLDPNVRQKFQSDPYSSSYMIGTTLIAPPSLKKHSLSADRKSVV